MDAKSDMEKKVLKIRKKRFRACMLALRTVFWMAQDSSGTPQERLKRAPRAEQEPGRALCNALGRTSRIDLRGMATKDAVLEASRLRFGSLQQ